VRNPSPEHLEENLGGAAIRLTTEDVNAITRFVPEDAGISATA
jgi:diketogulonate reductase-like aldo/keto reductase